MYGVEPRPKPNSTRPLLSTSAVAIALGQHVGVVRGEQQHREAEPDARRALADRRMQQVGTRAVTDLLEEMHLGQPEDNESPRASPATA